MAKYGEKWPWNRVEALINKLGGEEAAEAFLRGNLVVKAVDLLCKITEVSLSAIKKFIAAKAFVLDTTPTAKVKIGYLGESFKAYLLGKTEKNIPTTTLAVHQLVKASLDQPILDQLGDKAETTLAHLYELLTKQPNGESGTLLTNGCANVFYIKDINGKLWAVCVRWGASAGDWFVFADQLHDDRWDTGRQVFSQV